MYKAQVLPLPPMCGVIKPYQGVDLKAEATMVGRVGFNTINDCNMHE